jgi:hypothetical protein
LQLLSRKEIKYSLEEINYCHWNDFYQNLKLLQSNVPVVEGEVVEQIEDVEEVVDSVVGEDEEVDLLREVVDREVGLELEVEEEEAVVHRAVVSVAVEEEVHINIIVCSISVY